MIGQGGVVLAASGTYTEPLGWVVLAIFLAGVVASYVHDHSAHLLFALGWTVFAGFWLTLIYPWFAVDESFVRGAGAVIAVPLSLLVAKTMYEGRDSLVTLSRAVAFMGLIYVPFVMIDPLREQLTLMVVDHTSFAMGLIGFDPPVVTELSELGHLPQIESGDTIPGKEYDYENTFVFPRDDGGRITYTIILACTGIGSMSVIAGLIAAVNAPLRRKVRALAVAIPIIYVLNIIRNVFIGLSFGHQYMHIVPDATMFIFQMENELRVSYIWADRIIAQLLSVVAMIIIFWLVVQELPEIMQPVEEVLYLITGEEYDLAEALDIDSPDSTADSPEPAD
jgi:archaeosortase A (PGF-CTERM-specific)